ncbi:MAG: GIY-YIG nuclease family protein [Deltaproteobacteria bacterium]|nr:GIY-YIG nuclease family protein [Deltaproteobacteria bacterium]
MASKGDISCSADAAGHVYVISNIGSFGEGVFKIGMTRRENPLDRVRELGDASVPFHFDVHAMIYSEDVPTLENKLHRSLAAHQVNLVNERKEFFRVSLAEIERAVLSHHGEIVFTRHAEAEEYRKSLALQRQREHGRADGRAEQPVV